jgi:two-component system chemotaxis response regulator CheY
MKQVLIVDDSKLMREMIAACLRHLDEVEFVFAGTELEAIERLARCCQAPLDAMAEAIVRRV